MEVSQLQSARVRQLASAPRVRERRWPRLFALLGIFFILLYLYLNLSQPPLPVAGTEAAGVRSIFSIYGWKNERLSSPNGVAADGRGNIYVADTANHRVVVFGREGGFRFVIGNKLNRPGTPKVGPLLFPLSVAVAENGDIFVASMEQSLVFVFNKSGKYKQAFHVGKPIGLAAAGKKLYVSTPGEIWVYSLDGKFINRWGGFGVGLGSFRYPNGLLFSEKGHLFVSDTQNARLQIFDKNGKLVGWEGQPPKNLNDSRRRFGLNMGLAIDDKDRIYVADAFGHSIHVFDYEGKPLGEFGEQGDLDGRFNYPSDIAYLGGGAFAVADKWNDRVQVVRISMPGETDIAERARSIYPYAMLAGLVLYLIYLSWRRRKMVQAEETLREALGRR